MRGPDDLWWRKASYREERSQAARRAAKLAPWTTRLSRNRGGWVLPSLALLAVLVLLAGALSAAQAQSGSYYRKDGLSNQEYVRQAMKLYEYELAQSTSPKENPPPVREGDYYYQSPLGQRIGDGRYDQRGYEIRCWWVGKVWTCR